MCSPPEEREALRGGGATATLRGLKQAANIWFRWTENPANDDHQPKSRCYGQHHIIEITPESAGNARFAQRRFRFALQKHEVIAEDESERQHSQTETRKKPPARLRQSWGYRRVSELNPEPIRTIEEMMKNVDARKRAVSVESGNQSARRSPRLSDHQRASSEPRNEPQRYSKCANNALP